MALRCLLFSSDEGTAEPILQVLAALDVEGEHCSEAAAAVEKVTQQSFQIVIIDWDMQPEAGRLLTAARERKAAERPLTLAIVSDDISVPEALQAGANSILRTPLLVNQVRDTLTTARDLLRAKQESAATVALAAAAGVSGTGVSAGSVSALPANAEPGNERTLRAGEFLQSAPPAPGAQFVTESETHPSLEPSSAEPVDPLQDLEPMAASVAQEKPAAVPPPEPEERRGLEWYLKTRAASLPPVAVPASPPPAPGKPELIGYDQMVSPSPSPTESPDDVSQEPAPQARQNPQSVHKQSVQNRTTEPKTEPKREPKKEPELLASTAEEISESEEAPRPRARLGKGAIIALILATGAIVAAPQAPWHPQLRVALAHGRQAVRSWLNPQPVTPLQAPVSHEDFGRAGDEYKLPVTENIPDATTDPSQIHVVPVVDPTAKKPNNDGATPEQPAGQTPGQADAAGTTPNDPTPTSGTQRPDNQPPASAPETSPAPSPVPSPATATATLAASVPTHLDPPAVVAPPVASVALIPSRPAPPRNQEPRHASVPGNVPSSLKSQMASMTPEVSGNKPPEAAMQSIEPVNVPEVTERALLTEQAPLDYPASARGQQGTVILQVLIGRDGTVQDAKFMQGSLAFARSAIDGVKLWKFKPYALNGRPVSVQTLLTINFKP